MLTNYCPIIWPHELILIILGRKMVPFHCFFKPLSPTRCFRKLYMFGRLMLPHLTSVISPKTHSHKPWFVSSKTNKTQTPGRQTIKIMYNPLEMRYWAHTKVLNIRISILSRYVSFYTASHWENPTHGKPAISCKFMLLLLIYIYIYICIILHNIRWLYCINIWLCSLSVQREDSKKHY